MSGVLYHSIGDWAPTEIPQDLYRQNITPGRVGTVFFSPQASLKYLRGKPPRWAKRTMGGQVPDALSFDHSRAKEVRAKKRRKHH